MAPHPPCGSGALAAIFRTVATARNRPEGGRAWLLPHTTPHVLQRVADRSPLGLQRLYRRGLPLVGAPTKSAQPSPVGAAPSPRFSCRRDHHIIGPRAGERGCCRFSGCTAAAYPLRVLLQKAHNPHLWERRPRRDFRAVANPRNRPEGGPPTTVPATTTPHPNADNPRPAEPGRRERDWRRCSGRASSGLPPGVRRGHEIRSARFVPPARVPSRL